jgi:hypothetical protein
MALRASYMLSSAFSLFHCNNQVLVYVSFHSTQHFVLAVAVHISVDEPFLVFLLSYWPLGGLSFPALTNENSSSVYHFLYYRFRQLLFLRFLLLLVLRLLGLVCVLLPDSTEVCFYGF